jgi:hypothetical protein
LIDLPADLTTKSLQTALPIGVAIDGVGSLEAGDEEFEPQVIPTPPAVVAIRGDEQGRWHPQWAETPIDTRVRLEEREYRVGPAVPFISDGNLGTVSHAAVWAGSAESGAWVRVPVIDAAGGVCRQPFKTMPFDELLLSLSDWNTVDEVGDDTADLDEEGTGASPIPRSAGGAEGRDQFPVSRAAMLIEQIAQVHDALELHGVPAWLRRLEALLTEALDTALLDAWRKLEIDFTCLAEPAFCPACLADAQGEEAHALRGAYLNLLTRVRARWQFTQES